MNPDTTIELERFAASVKAGFEKRREAQEQLDQRQLELSARLLDLEQKAARRGSSVGSDAICNAAKSLGDAAEALVGGMADANSFRTTLSVGVRAALTGTGVAGPERFDVPTTSLGLVGVQHSPAVRLLDLLPGVPVDGNTIQFVRVAMATNAAAIVAELATKPESALATTLITRELPTWAHHISASRQVLSDVAGLRAMIDSLMTRGLLDKVDAGAFAELTLAGNFTAFVPTAGDTIGDAVARIAAQVVNAGGANVVVAVSPVDWLSMSLAKASTSGVYLGLPPNLALRVAAVASVAAGKILAFSPSTGASYADRQAIMVEAGYVASGFIENRTTILAECRGLAYVTDPALVAYGSLPAVA